MVKDLDITSWTYHLGLVTTSGSTATAAFTAHVVLGGLGSWNYPNTLHLAKVSGAWKVEWTPATIFHSLPVGGHFLIKRTWGPRAAVLGTGATVLAGPADVVTVGLQGNAITSAPLVTTALTQAGIAPALISAALQMAAAHPTQFIPVTQLSAARYQQVKPIIFPVPGTRFQLQAGQTTATPDLAAHVVGSVGPITAEELSQLGAPYEATDSVGQVGIEAQDERQLAGTPGGTIDVVGADGTDLGTVGTIPGKPGVSVQTTLDLHTEEAAETALNGEKLPVALVAIQASTGDVLAAVSRPDTTPFDRALQGQYPPGSTFKVVTSTALLTSGLTPSSPATCPKTLTVDGRSFKNFEGEAALNITFEQAFEVSCNTAFIGMAGNLTDQNLIAGAAQYDFGATLQPGLPVFGGQIPQPVDEVEKVADAIGQGRVLASPLEMAGVAAAVDSGAYHAPLLVVGAADGTDAAHSPVAGGGCQLADHDAGGGDRRHGHRGQCLRWWAGVRQDGHGGVRQRQPADDPRLVHRISRRCRLRHHRRGWWRWWRRGGADCGQVPPGAFGRLGPLRVLQLPWGPSVPCPGSGAGGRR